MYCHLLPIHNLNTTLNGGSVECLAQIGQAAGEKGTSEDSKFRQILGLKAVHVLAFFILVYVGVEVTIGGASFIQSHLHRPHPATDIFVT